MRIGEVRNAERAQGGKPLEGVRVLAIEQMQALPYGTQLMAHLGADVVKVEHPETGESGRGARPQLTDDDGRRVGATYLRNNLSKRSLGIDLKQPEGTDLVRRLVPHFDVVAENFKPGTMQRLGLGYAELAALHPALIYVSVSGFGNLDPTPYADWPAYAPIAEAMGGLYEPNPLGDVGSALFCVIGTLAALRHRDRTGLGQQVDVALYDSMVAIADMVPFMWSMGEGPEMATAGSTGICAAFRARDGYFVMAVFREHQLERLAHLVGHPEWIGDPRFATRAGWARHTESVVRPAVEAWAAERSKLEAAHELCAQGVAAGPSNTAEDIRADPHVQTRNMLIEVPRPDRPDDAPPMLVVGNPVKLSRMAEGPVRRFPRLGEHTAEVLRETLGLGDPELAELRRKRVIPEPSAEARD
jgi:formyl-CoA transferase